MPEEISNKTYIVFCTTPFLCAPTPTCASLYIAVVSSCARRFFGILIEDPDE